MPRGFIHRLLPLVLALPALTVFPLSSSPRALTPQQAGKLAIQALSCLDREYPNKLDHVMAGPDAVLPPHTLHPAFFGCLDWHSSVHGHWLLAHLLRTVPGLPNASEARRVLDSHLRPESIQVEVVYLGHPEAAGFERTYGWAWLLKLDSELRTWDDPDARRWEEALRPLAEAIATRLSIYLPKLSYPIRTGIHPNTAFTLSLALDYARTADDRALLSLLQERARTFYGSDRSAPGAWEPGGEDFLSPVLEEADLMRQVLPPAEFRDWLKAFLPDLDQRLPATLFTPAVVTDRSDPRIVHLDGLNLSRARCLFSLARALGTDDPRRKALKDAAEAHLGASIPHVADANYGGEHWLATFALRALDESY